MSLLLPFAFFKKREITEGKKRIHPVVMIIPALFDVLATIFDSSGLIYVSIIYII